MRSRCPFVLSEATAGRGSRWYVWSWLWLSLLSILLPIECLLKSSPNPVLLTDHLFSLSSPLTPTAHRIQSITYSLYSTCTHTYTHLHPHPHPYTQTSSAKYARKRMGKSRVYPSAVPPLLPRRENPFTANSRLKRTCHALTLLNQPTPATTRRKSTWTDGRCTLIPKRKSIASLLMDPSEPMEHDHGQDSIDVLFAGRLDGVDAQVIKTRPTSKDKEMFLEANDKAKVRL